MPDEHLRTGLKVTTLYLYNRGEYTMAYYVRQALDKLYPEWRKEK